MSTNTECEAASNDIMGYAIQKAGAATKDDTEMLATLTAAAIKIMSAVASYYPLRQRDDLMEFTMGIVRDEARKLGGALGGVARYETEGGHK